jgi:hypothetical protein
MKVSINFNLEAFAIQIKTFQLGQAAPGREFTVIRQFVMEKGQATMAKEREGQLQKTTLDRVRKAISAQFQTIIRPPESRQKDKREFRFPDWQNFDFDLSDDLLDELPNFRARAFAPSASVQVDLQ